MSEAMRDRAGHWLRRIGLEVTKDYPEGRHEEILTIYTDDPKYAELRVAVTLVKNFQQRLVATPGDVLLSGNPGQPLPSRIILIRDRDNQEVHIDHVMTDDPSITCRWAQGPNKMATLRILVDRTRISGDSLESAVHVEVSKPIPETLTIPVKCFTK